MPPFTSCIYGINVSHNVKLLFHIVNAILYRPDAMSSVFAKGEAPEPRDKEILSANARLEEELQQEGRTMV